MEKDRQNTIAVVGGGTGAVGEGIVRHFLTENMTVVVPCRTPEKAGQLEKSMSDITSGELVCRQATLSNYGSAEKFKEFVFERFGRVDLAVASIGGWYQGEPLHKMPVETYRKIMDDNLNAHFIFAKLFFTPMLTRNKGTYVNLNGGSIKKITPGAGIVSVAGRALEAMTHVFAQEAEGTEVKVFSVALFTPVVSRDLPRLKSQWISAKQTAEYILMLHDSGKSGQNGPMHVLNSVDDLKNSYLFAEMY